MKLKYVDRHIRGYDQLKCSSQKNLGPEICGSSGQDQQLPLWVGRVSNKEDVCWGHLVSDVSKGQHKLAHAPTVEAARKALTLNSGSKSSFILMRPCLRQHRTPEEATLSCGQRPAGALNLCEQSAGGGLRMSSCLSQGTRIHAAEVSAAAAAASRKWKPISRASKRPCGRLRPCQDLSAPAEEASVSAPSTQRPRQKQQSLAAMSESSTFPKGFHKTRSRRRDPRKLAAAMERVRQWEILLLQNLEEASQHQLTIETENKRPVSQRLQFSAEDPPGASSDLNTGHGLLSFWTHVH